MRRAKGAVFTKGIVAVRGINASVSCTNQPPDAVSVPPFCPCSLTVECHPNREAILVRYQTGALKGANRIERKIMTGVELNEAGSNIVRVRRWDRFEVPHVLSPEAKAEEVATAVMVTCFGVGQPIEGRQLKLRHIISLLKEYDANWGALVETCNRFEKAEKDKEM